MPAPWDEAAPVDDPNEDQADEHDDVNLRRNGIRLYTARSIRVEDRGSLYDPEDYHDELSRPNVRDRVK